MTNEKGFGIVMVLGVLATVGTLGLALGLLILSGEWASAGAVDRAVAYYLAEGVVKKAISDDLAIASNWSDFSGDTLYASLPMDQGTCTLVIGSASRTTAELTAEAQYRRVRGILRLRLKREGFKYVWERLDDPFIESKKE